VAKYLKTTKYSQATGTVIKKLQRPLGNPVLDEKGLAKRGLLMRHLVMPGSEEDLRKVIRF
jgi:putative pyruvate formate lyase activating enzyme